MNRVRQRLNAGNRRAVLTLANCQASFQWRSCRYRRHAFIAPFSGRKGTGQQVSTHEMFGVQKTARGFQHVHARPRLLRRARAAFQRYPSRSEPFPPVDITHVAHRKARVSARALRGIVRSHVAAVSSTAALNHCVGDPAPSVAQSAADRRRGTSLSAPEGPCWAP